MNGDYLLLVLQGWVHLYRGAQGLPLSLWRCVLPVITLHIYVMPMHTAHELSLQRLPMLALHHVRWQALITRCLPPPLPPTRSLQT